MDASQLLDRPMAEQVVSVPKISRSSSSFPRGSPRAADGGNIVVEVLIVVSFSSLQQQTAERVIDIPVPRTSSGDQVEVFEVFPPGRGSSQRTVEQIVDIPAVGGLQEFCP